MQAAREVPANKLRERPRFPWRSILVSPGQLAVKKPLMQVPEDAEMWHHRRLSTSKWSSLHCPTASCNSATSEGVFRIFLLPSKSKRRNLGQALSKAPRGLTADSRHRLSTSSWRESPGSMEFTRSAQIWPPRSTFPRCRLRSDRVPANKCRRPSRPRPDSRGWQSKLKEGWELAKASPR